MEQKMSSIHIYFILLVFSAVTWADDRNEFPYDDCKWLECAGMKGDKGDCMKDCDILLIRSVDYSQPEPLLAHRLYWIPKPNTEDFRYAAVGYSDDKEMGNDDVTACYEWGNELDFMTGVSTNEKVIPVKLSPITELYKKRSDANLCAWTTKITFTKEYSYMGRKNQTFDLSKPLHILLGRGSTDTPLESFLLSLHSASDNTFNFNPVACKPQAYILDSFYCWREDGPGNEWRLYVTIHVKDQSTRFQVTFNDVMLAITDGSMSIGLSLYPTKKDISLVKCSFNEKTISIQDAFEGDEGVQDLEANPPISNKQVHNGKAYKECVWSRSSNSWKYNSYEFNTSQNPLYLSLRSNQLNSNLPKFTDWPLVFPGFTDEELVACDGNCVGMRDENKTDNECVPNKTCIITLVVKVSEGKYLFSVRSALTFGVWTSVSLSAEASSNVKLGFDCAIKGEVDAKPSGEVTTMTNKDEKGSKAVKILNANLTENPRRMTCEFEVEKPITFPGEEEGKTLDLEQNEAFVTIAYGRLSGQKEKARQSVTIKKSFQFNDDDGQAERTFLVILSLTCVALFVVSTLSVIGLGLYLYHPKKRKGVKVKKGAKRKSLKIKSRKSSPVGSKIDKGSPTSNI